LGPTSKARAGEKEGKEGEKRGRKWKRRE